MSAVAPAGLELPDEPRWVEAHGILAEASSWVRTWPSRAADASGAAGALVGHREAELAVLIGRCEPGDEGARAVVSATLAEQPGLTLLCAEEASAQLAQWSGRQVRLATLHTLPAPLEPQPLEVAPLEGHHELGHAPAPLRDELGRARGRGRVWTVWVDGLPVSFAYASWRSPRWFDVSVDTLPGARQLGLGELAARALILDEQAQGRAAVWGALDDNLASRRLAARLGFVAVDRLAVLPPRSAP